ncbi:alpha/beta fold hydrolase [Streptomyces sp. NBC_01476]|uniref:alpha/beta hydrolase n=1 Tax=Streptomyces sp. NBC_01476 TaxID=2903881 RepID=UPI002E360A18|nr:alpha/beta fold hydrolase [Streptomyces sp. NBC_01476]
MEAAVGAPPAEEVRDVLLEGAGVALSALLSEPPGGAAPRALVVAVHGGGMTARYFDARAWPGLSLLRLGARLGFAVLAVDRPGYGRSAEALPEGMGVEEQTTVLRAAVAGYARRHPAGAGVFLLGHSFGGKPALCWAARAEQGDHLLGVDVSGCGRRYAADGDSSPLAGPGGRRQHWGPLRLYPQGTFRAGADMVAPVPAREAAELTHWPESFARLAPRVRVPVRFTFAEHEALWRHRDADLAELAACFAMSPRVLLDRQPDAGHNLSLGWAARAYHLRALGFLEECLVQNALAPGGPAR